MTATMPNIEFVRFSKLYNWSVQHLLEDTFSYNQDFPLVTIGTFLKRNKVTINVQNGVSYKRVTIKINNGGVYLRDIEVGENIGTKKQFEVRKGQFIFSRIDARNGAMGFVPDVLDGAIVTNDFPVFDVDNSLINTEYLVLVTTTKRFIEFAQSSSSGTTNRQRIDVEAFLSVQIPLPPLDDEDAKKRNLPNVVTQEKLVAAYNQKIDEAEAAKNKAKEKDAEIEEYLLTELGIISDSANLRSNSISFIKFRHLERWDVWSINKNLMSKKWDSIQLRNVISLRSGNFLPANKMKEGDFNVYGGNGLISKHNKFFLSGRRIIIGRVGAYCGNIHIVNGNYWVTDNALWAELLIDINIDFLALTLKSINLNRLSTVSAQPSISQSVIYDEFIPLPPIQIQETIVKAIDTIKSISFELKAKCEKLKQEALFDFEHQIFKHD